MVPKQEMFGKKSKTIIHVCTTETIDIYARKKIEKFAFLGQSEDCLEKLPINKYITV